MIYSIFNSFKKSFYLFLFLIGFFSLSFFACETGNENLDRHLKELDKKFDEKFGNIDSVVKDKIESIDSIVKEKIDSIMIK